MLSIGTISAGHGFYYTDLAREQYYTEGGEPPGQWYGAAAKELGYEGVVEKQDLFDLLQGSNRDGEPLVQNAGKNNRQAGLDLTFSADKSVSVLWALSPPDTRRLIEQAQDQAVSTALRYLEQEAAWTRRGHGGTELEKCRFAFARFQHSTSRASDPNLHTHVLVPNVGLREDGTTAAIWNNELYWHKMAAGAVYRAELAHALGENGLGYRIQADPKRGLFRLKDVSEKLCEHFSKRREQIERELMENGYSGAEAAAAANQATRQVKGHEALGDLSERWAGEARKFGFFPRQVLPVPEPLLELDKPRRPRQSPYELVTEVAEKLAETRGTFRPQDLVRALGARSMHGLVSGQVVADACGAAADSSTLVVVGETDFGPIFTTKRELDREGALLQVAAELANTPGLQAKPRTVELIKNLAERGLDSEERRAALDYLTTDPGNLKVLAGYAGTGKTSLLSSAREVWERSGFKVVGMAVSGKAARELANGAGIESETVRKRELELSPMLAEQFRHHASELTRAARYGKAKGYKGSPMARLELDSKTVVVIDECSMLGVKDTAAMLVHAKNSGAKVVLVGDEHQLPAIEGVSPFEAIGRHIGRFQLTDVKRQEKPWMRQAVIAFATGDTSTGLSLLQANGALHMSTGGPEATKGKLIEDWMKVNRGPSPKLLDSLVPDAVGRRVHSSDTLILTATNEAKDDLNSRAQEARRAARELGTIPVRLSGDQAGHRGDRVVFEKNNRHLGVWNGDLGTIVRVDKPIDANILNRGEVSVELDHGKRVRVNLNSYSELSLGYALTTHKAQGSTVDSAFVYTTPGAASRDMLYVQTSRARNHLGVYAPGHDMGEDLGEMQRALGRPTGGELALEAQLELQPRMATEQEQRHALEEARRAKLAEEQQRHSWGHDL